MPKLGYTFNTWHQEVTFGSIRLDFIAFAVRDIPITLDENSPLGLILEGKHPKQNLDRHIQRLERHLRTLRVPFGLITNGRELKIYKRDRDDAQLVFQCDAQNIVSRTKEIKYLIGREELKSRIEPSKSPIIIDPERPKDEVNMKMKTIAVFHNKGGVGKTTTVVNLAAALSNKGKRVLVIDFDSQANTTFAAGLIKFEDEEFDDIKDSNIYHVIKSEEFYKISEVSRKSDYCNPAIHIIPSHITLMKHEEELTRLDYSRIVLIEKLKEAQENFDIVLIDTPPSLNLYARIALISADYLIIPSDLKPYANLGLPNVRELVREVNGYRKMLNILPLKILGVLACKISTNPKFKQYTLPMRISSVMERYDFEVMETVIYEREDLAKCAEQIRVIGGMEIVDPQSVLDFKPDSESAKEFKALAEEVLKKIG